MGMEPTGAVSQSVESISPYVSRCMLDAAARAQPGSSAHAQLNACSMLRCLGAHGALHSGATRQKHHTLVCISVVFMALFTALAHNQDLAVSRWDVSLDKS